MKMKGIKRIRQEKEEREKEEEIEDEVEEESKGRRCGTGVGGHLQRAPRLIGSNARYVFFFIFDKDEFLHEEKWGGEAENEFEDIRMFIRDILKALRDTEEEKHNFV